MARAANAFRVLLVSGFLTAILAACDDPTAPALELVMARARWAQHSQSYTLTVRRSCECLDVMSGPVIVVVLEGQVESRHYVASGASVPSTYAQLFPTVEGLFAIIEDAMRQNAARLDVSYDPAGYPARIAIDYDAVMVDDEIWYNAELH